MPRQRKGARLWLRPERRDATGAIISRAAWFILDGGKQFGTGCSASETERAEGLLAAHITAKYQPERTERALSQIKVCDVLAIYVSDCGPSSGTPKPEMSRFTARISRLNEFFGDMTLSEITGATCRSYVASRGKPGGARRDLEDLRAAINHHQSEGLHRGEIGIILPEKGPPRDRWLTRDEAARLLWVCWKTQERQTIHRGTLAGSISNTKRHPLRHLARFVLIGLYTGTRAGAIASSSPIKGEGRSWMDLDRGIFYRLAEGRAATKKRQPPVPVPPRLLAHMRRWAKKDALEGRTFFVEWAGKPVASVKTGFGRAAKLAGLGDDVIPHTLRHTAATWLMQAGVSIWEAAGFLGMSPEMVDRVYGHHHPDHLRQAAASLGNRRHKAQSLVVSLAAEKKTRQKTS